jgi:hypothetical protein
VLSSKVYDDIRCWQRGEGVERSDVAITFVFERLVKKILKDAPCEVSTCVSRVPTNPAPPMMWIIFVS